jgi:hypothetical protein
MEAIPSHCTLQPPVLELTGPHPGGALQPKSIGDANAAIAKILPRPMRPPHSSSLIKAITWIVSYSTTRVYPDSANTAERSKTERHGNV